MTLLQDSSTFLRGLSDLWSKFFREVGQLNAMYKGTEAVVGQAYLDLLSTVLNWSVRETPVFHKEYFSLITIREDLVEQRVTDGFYAMEVTDIGLKDMKFLSNRVFEPSLVLENGVDMEVDTSGDTDVIVFYTDPFDYNGTGEPRPGIPYQTVQVLQDDGTSTSERELLLWAIDAQFDEYDLYLNYGYLVGRFEPSSEAYRSLIRGIVRYFVLGPTVSVLTSALNVIVGLPVIREDGEVLQSVSQTDTETTVTTDKTTYTFDPVIPIRDDVLDEDNWGTLTFEAFEALTSTFTVSDVISDPTWWYGKVIPERLLPGESQTRRQIYPQLWENLINNPPGLVKIGDPGFIIGADEDGYVPTGRNGYRHCYAYVVFERFLKHHAFIMEIDSGVIVAGALPFERLTLDLQNIVVAGKSAYTYLYAEPGLLLYDNLKIVDDDESMLEIEAELTVEDFGAQTDNSFVIGEAGVVIGDYYYYSGASLVVKNESTDPIGTPFENGKTPVVIGGCDPTKMPGKYDGAGSGDPDAGLFGYDSGLGKYRLIILGGHDRLGQENLGRWIYRPDQKTYHYITAIQNDTYLANPVTLVVFDETSIPTSTGNEAWDLYGAPGQLNHGDWGVQIEVETVP